MSKFARLACLFVAVGLSTPAFASQVDTYLPNHGTIGTVIDFTGLGFGTTPRQSWLLDTATNKKYALKTLPGFTDTAFSAEIKKAVAGTLELWVKPKGQVEILAGNFTIDLPQLTAVQDTLGAKITSTSPGTEFYIVGENLGTKKGKVFAGGKKCTVKEWFMTGILCATPKSLANGTWPLEAINKIGSNDDVSIEQTGSTAKIGKAKLDLKKNGATLALKVAAGGGGFGGAPFTVAGSNAANPAKLFALQVPYQIGDPLPATFVQGTDFIVCTYLETNVTTFPPVGTLWTAADGFDVTINAESGGQVSGIIGATNNTFTSGTAANITIDGTFIVEVDTTP